MIRDVWMTIVPRRVGEEVYVAKVAKGTAATRWRAQRVINALRAKVPLEMIAMDVVVIDGEPNEQPTMIGSSAAAETYVQSIASDLQTYRWSLTKLDW